MPYTKTSSSILASAAGNIEKAKAINTDNKQAKAVNDKAVQSAAVVQTRTINTENMSQRPPRNKKQEKKLRAEKANAKKEQAKQITKLAEAGTLTARPVFQKTPFVIATDADATNSTSVGAAPSPDDADAAATSAEITSNVAAPELTDPREDAETALFHSPRHKNDDDIEDELAQSSEVGVSKVALLLKKKQEVNSRAQVVQSNGKPRKHKPQKKNRKPLDSSAKKDHSKVDNVVKLVDRKFNTTMTILENVHGVKSPEHRPRPSCSSRSSSPISPTSPPSSLFSMCPGSPVEQPLSDDETAIAAASIFVPFPEAPFSHLENKDISDAVETVSSDEIMDEDVEEIVASAPKIPTTVENVTDSPASFDEVASSPTGDDVDSSSISNELTIGLSTVDDSVENHAENDLTEAAQLDKCEDEQEDLTDETASTLLPGEEIPDDSSKSDAGSGDSEDKIGQQIEKPAPNEPVKEHPLNFLLFPNVAQYPSILARDEEAALTTTHVGPYVPPVFPQQPSRAERRAAKIKYVCGNLCVWDEEEKPASSVKEPVTEPEDDVVVEVAPFMSTPSLEQDKPSQRARKALDKKAQEKLENQFDKLLAILEKTEDSLAVERTVEHDAAIPSEQIDTTSEQIAQDSAPVVPQAHEGMSKNAMKKAARIGKQAQQKADKKAAKETQQSAAANEKESKVSSVPELTADEGSKVSEEPQEPIAEDVPVSRSDELVAAPTTNQATTEVIEQLDPVIDHVPKDTMAPIGEAAAFVKDSTIMDDVSVVADEVVREEPVSDLPALDELDIEISSADSSTATEQIGEISTMLTEDTTIKHELKPTNDGATPASDEIENRFDSPNTGDRSRRGSSTSNASEHSSSSAELERKARNARNIFVGITSLEDFIVKLEYDQTNRITHKLDVCEAFAACCADEDAVYEGCDAPTVNHDFRLVSAQRKIKLGAKSLHAFLRTIHFDDEGFTTTAAVVKAFRSASYSSDAPSDKLMRILALESEYST